MSIEVARSPFVVRKNGDTADIGIHIAERSHEMAMSENPEQAAHGRFMKEVAPAFMRWMEAEKQRIANTGHADVDAIAAAMFALTEGFGYGVANMLVNFGANLAGAQAVGLARVVVGTVSECVDAAEKTDIGSGISAAMEGR